MEARETESSNDEQPHPSAVAAAPPRRFTAAQLVILNVRYNTGMKGIGAQHSHRIEHAAREAELTAEQVKVMCKSIVAGCSQPIIDGCMFFCRDGLKRKITGRSTPRPPVMQMNYCLQQKE